LDAHGHSAQDARHDFEALTTGRLR